MPASTSLPNDRPSARLHETATLIERLIVLGIVAGLLTGAAMILRPFVTAILFSCILVIATWPLRSWLVRHGLSAGVTATFLLLILLGIIGVPAILLTPTMGEHLTENIARVQAYFAAAPALPEWLDTFPLLKERIGRTWSELSRPNSTLQEAFRPYSTEVRNFIVTFGRLFAEGMLQFILALMLATMFWYRGEVLAGSLIDISERLGGTVGRDALNDAANSIRGIAYGILGTAAIQAIAMTVVLFIAGIPAYGLLGLLTLVIAISQIGVLLILIWGGAAWWLFSTGFFGWGVFMIVAGVLISVIDNAIRPWLVSFGATMPITLIFLGVLGGVIAFGFLGLFIGPTLLGVSFSLLQAWRQRPVEETVAEERG